MFCDRRFIIYYCDYWPCRAVTASFPYLVYKGICPFPLLQSVIWSIFEGMSLLFVELVVLGMMLFYVLFERVFYVLDDISSSPLLFSIEYRQLFCAMLCLFFTIICENGFRILNYMLHLIYNDTSIYRFFQY